MIIKNVLVKIFCESTSSHPCNIVAISISRNLVQIIVIYDFVIVCHQFPYDPHPSLPPFFTNLGRFLGFSRESMRDGTQLVSSVQSA